MADDGTVWLVPFALYHRVFRYLPDGTQDLRIVEQGQGPREFMRIERIETGPEDERIALRGRVADMIVVTRVAKDGDSAMRATLEGALLDSGSPLFVVPPEGMAGRLSSAAIAWNGSAEVARAVSLALPLLVKTETVFVLRIEEGLRPGPSADELVAYLARHGIGATVHPTQSNHLPTGNALLSDAKAVEADFW